MQVQIQNVIFIWWETDLLHFQIYIANFLHERMLTRIIYSSQEVCEQAFGGSYIVYDITSKKRGNLATVSWYRSVQEDRS